MENEKSETTAASPLQKIVSGDEHKDCEGNSVKEGDFIAFQPPAGPRRYAEVITICKSQDDGITYAYIHDRIYNFTILETSLLCKNH